LFAEKCKINLYHVIAADIAELRGGNKRRNCMEAWKLFTIAAVLAVFGIIAGFISCANNNEKKDDNDFEYGKGTENLIFSDDFDGTELNKINWDLCPEWDRQGRSTWKDDMVYVSGGNLHLKFKRDAALGASKSKNSAIANNWIRAGAVRTRKKNDTILFQNNYGYYEARIKFPVVSGTWGAFWLMGTTVGSVGNGGKDGTEIDIVETIRNQNGEYNAALHWDGYGADHKSVGSDKNNRPVNIYDGEFHVFALDWSPTEYVFSVDGKEFWRVDGGAKFQNVGINKKPNYIKLTVESADWAGDIPNDFNESEMLVDYVRVYRKKPSE